MDFLEIVAIFVSFALLIVWLTAVSNFLFFPRLQTATPASAPFVSLLIPARDEAAVIASAVQLLLAQQYPHFELIVLDDGSTDGTAVLAQQAAASDPRFRLIQGQPLPPGWLGKNWACHQLSQAAQGEILIFTDADVQWQPGALAAVIGNRYSVFGNRFADHHSPITVHRSPIT
ncbi:MAG: glycosyltransferase, partial [Anaerolinea sp.]|nr:glycosyltransferase [Anaerolinea sp.]